MAHFLTLDELQFHYAPLSTEKNQLNANFKIFPNPAKDIINVSYHDNLEITDIQLLDTSGKVVKIYRSTNRELNVSGMYSLNIQTNQGSIYEKN